MSGFFFASYICPHIDCLFSLNFELYGKCWSLLLHEIQHFIFISVCNFIVKLPGLIFLSKPTAEVSVSLKSIIKEKENDQKIIILIAAYFVRTYFQGRAFTEIQGYDLNIFPVDLHMWLCMVLCYTKVVHFSFKVLSMINIYTTLFKQPYQPCIKTDGCNRIPKQSKTHLFLLWWHLILITIRSTS